MENKIKHRSLTLWRNKYRNHNFCKTKQSTKNEMFFSLLAMYFLHFHQIEYFFFKNDHFSIEFICSVFCFAIIMILSLFLSLIIAYQVFYLFFTIDIVIFASLISCSFSLTLNQIKKKEQPSNNYNWRTVSYLKKLSLSLSLFSCVNRFFMFCFMIWAGKFYYFTFFLIE